MLFRNKKTKDRKRRLRTRTWRLHGNLLFRLGLILLLISGLTMLFPAQQSYEYSGFREGTISQAEVIAPQTFSVFKNPEDYQREVAMARREIRPLMIYHDSVHVGKLKALSAFFTDIKRHVLADETASAHLPSTSSRHQENISTATLQMIMAQASRDIRNLDRLNTAVSDLLEQTYEIGIIARKADVPVDGNGEITLNRNNLEHRIKLDTLLDLSGISLYLQEVIKKRLPNASQSEIKVVYELATAYLTPNVTYDISETQRRQDEMANSVTRIKGTVLKGERIIDEHDRIAHDHIDKLNSLIDHMNRQRQDDPLIHILQRGAQAVFCALILAIFFGFLHIFKPAVFRPISNIVLFGIAILMPAIVAHYADQYIGISPFLVPVALSAMLVTVLFDAEIGLVITLVCTAICAGILGELQFGLVFLITGIIGAYSVRQVRHRSDFYHSIVYLVAAYVLTIAATAAILFTYVNMGEYVAKIRHDLLFGLFAAGASSVLTIGLLPIFESVFGVVTPITLLELSDLNRPLLRNLAIRAPGTYSHSMNMANLSEAAADAIGADRLLARVGCYYHDIGKMIRPHYFIENQKGVNPHDELQPKMSALILISHVKDGIELAEEEGLPKAIVDLIPQHHGTSEIASFKHRAIEMSGKQAVRDEDFRYPGPKPQTKEAGIINLADAVESATRTLSQNAPDQIRGMVQTIIKGRFTAGELDECDLTLRDLTQIQEAFLPVLQASRHQRVPYPWQVQQTPPKPEKRG